MRNIVLRCIAIILVLPVRVSALDLMLDVQGGRCEGKITVAIEASDGESTWRGKSELPLETPIAADLAPNRVWTFQVVGDAVWAPERSIFITEDEPRLTLPVWLASPITGTPKWPPDDEAAPIELWFSPAGEGRDGPVERWRVSCPVAEGLFSCSAPRGHWDLKLRAQGHVSHLFWDRRIGATGLELGRLRFVRGASVLGWVRTAESAVPEHGCSLKLTPYTAKHLDEAPAQRLDLKTACTTPDDRGFFQFAGVAPGRYAVTATQDGFAPARRFPVDVGENAETLLVEPLVLERPLRLELRVSPQLDPTGRTWTVSLYQIDKFSTVQQPLVKTTPIEGGFWRSEPVAPSSYTVLLKTEDGSIWSVREVDLRPGDELVEFFPDFVPVSGRIELGDRPLAANLSFTPAASRGAVAPSVKAASNSDGVFECQLPEEGLYNVKIAVVESRIHRSLSDVSVKRVGGAPKAHVTLRLSDHKLTGRVVDSKGEPVNGARVTLINTRLISDSQGVPTDDTGIFTFQSVADGSYTISARDQWRRSSSHELTITEDEDPPSIELQLDEDDLVRGRVVGGAGVGVTGAQVHWMGPTSYGAEITATELGGRFEVGIPSSQRPVLFYVFAPGYALGVSRWEGSADSEVELRVTQLGGSVSVTGLSEVRPSGRLLALFRDGLFIPGPYLRGWAASHGHPSALDAPEVVVPMLEPGVWAACTVTVADMLNGLPIIKARETGFHAGCDTGTLVPGGELELTIR